jgi:hypothetical protein
MRVESILIAVVIALLAALGCSESLPKTDEAPPTKVEEGEIGTDLADVISVQASGQPSAYQFAVEIASPDTGCDRYADWWEVVSENGELVYRRILLHSHVGEQPFTRSGGPVAIEADTVVWVRAHMHPGGYGGVALKGSVQTGFEVADAGLSFGAELETQPPLPDGCAF